MKYSVALLIWISGCTTVNDPHVWAPLATAALLQINDTDEKISDELYENNPVFGDVENAKDWSDNFRSYTTTSYILAGAAMPVELDTKILLLIGEWASVEAVDHIRGELQHSIARERPDGSGLISMPSGHTTTATYQASLARTNISYLNISTATKQKLNISVTSFAVLAGYARIEAGRHYPSDVLVGYALGNFFGNISETVINQQHRNNTCIV